MVSKSNEKNASTMPTLRMLQRARHAKAKTNPDSYPERRLPIFEEGEDHVGYNLEQVKFNYDPPYYDDPAVLAADATIPGSAGWADPVDPSKVDWSKRFSHYGRILLCAHPGRAINPVGVTGLAGRGLLGKHGPNHAADCLITCNDGRKLKFVAIKRKDNGQWALPGGMVDEGEAVAKTVVREFREEAARLTNEEGGEEAKKALDKILEKHKGVVVFKGYVDDPRNTDNAWIETVAIHRHLSPEEADSLQLSAGDDASAVKWMTASMDNEEYVNLYASHRQITDSVFADMSTMSLNMLDSPARKREKRPRVAVEPEEPVDL